MPYSRWWFSQSRLVKNFMLIENIELAEQIKNCGRFKNKTWWKKYFLICPQEASVLQFDWIILKHKCLLISLTRYHRIHVSFFHNPFQSILNWDGICYTGVASSNRGVARNLWINASPAECFLSTKFSLEWIDESYKCGCPKGFAMN